MPRDIHRITRRQMVPVVIVRPLVFPLVRHLRGHPGVAREDLLGLYRAVAEGLALRISLMWSGEGFQRTRFRSKY